MPEVIAVFIQHTTPFYDDSYVLNSPNNGPYGDAITQELIPEIDRRFRTVAAPYARVLTGGSTGGWDVLALQIHYPDVFGGAWSLYPDQLDFRNYQFGNIYADSNAFVRNDGSWLPREVPSSRSVEGITELTVREENQAELVIASRGRSGGQWDGWAAAWAPVGADGYPRSPWDKRTGVIDRAVADSMRARGYDLRDYVERNWSHDRTEAGGQAARGGWGYGQLFPQPRRVSLRDVSREHEGTWEGAVLCGNVRVRAAAQAARVAAVEQSGAVADHEAAD